MFELLRAQLLRTSSLNNEIAKKDIYLFRTIAAAKLKSTEERRVGLKEI